MGLRRAQRNAVHAILSDARLDPREFDWDMGSDAPTLHHRRSDSWFRFSDATQQFGTSVVGGAQPKVEPGDEWEDVERRIRQWAAEVKEEAETPDLWAQLASTPTLLSQTTDEVSNTPFEPDELAQIDKHVELIRLNMRRQHALTTKQLRELEAGLAHIQESAKRLGRKDWRLLVGGVMLGLIVEALVPPEVIQELFQTVWEGLSYLFPPSGPQLPPPGIEP